MTDPARPYATIRADLLEGGAVLRVTLDQPRANILSMAMMADIAAALDAHAGAPGLKAVLLRGAGGNFSFGASVPEHVKALAPKMLSSFHAFIRKVARFPVPVVALVEGRCLGGAFELALAAHVVFAAQSAVFACPEVKLGVLPPVLAVLGHHRLGAPLAERMLFSGCEIDAQRALASGFAAEVVPEGTDLEAHALAWFGKNLAPLSAFALREATAVAREGSGMFASLEGPLDLAEKRYVDRVLASHDGNEGIESFLGKRAPAWKNA